MKFNLDEAKFEAIRNGEKVSLGGNLSVEMSGEELVQYGNVIINVMEFAKNFVKEEKEFRSKVNERRDLEEIIIKLKKENEKLKIRLNHIENERTGLEEIINKFEKENKKIKLELDRIKFGSSPVNE